MTTILDGSGRGKLGRLWNEVPEQMVSQDRDRFRRQVGLLAMCELLLVG